MLPEPTGLLRDFCFTSFEQQKLTSRSRWLASPGSGSRFAPRWLTRAVGHQGACVLAGSDIARATPARYARPFISSLYPAPPAKRLASLSQGSCSWSSVSRRRVLRSARPSTERTRANLRRSHRPRWPGQDPYVWVTSVRLCDILRMVKCSQATTAHPVEQHRQEQVNYLIGDENASQHGHDHRFQDIGTDAGGP